jgi:hypothetical protein
MCYISLFSQQAAPHSDSVSSAINYFCLFKEYVRAPGYVSSDEKGLESVVGPQDVIHVTG